MSRWDSQFLEKIMQFDARFAANDNFASDVYHDEPIIITDAREDGYTPPKYRSMRKIAMNSGAGRESYEKIFYKQGKFMEDFEDDFDFRGEFVQYFPSYQSMNDHQLRGYFSWRTKVRRGVIGKTSLSFVFVYIYELINRIGARTPEEGFFVLKNFWTAYKELDARINRYVKLWLKDYIVYYNLDKFLLQNLVNTDSDNAVLTLLRYKSHGADEVFSALNSLSSYKMEKSSFFKQYSDDVKNVACAVFVALSDYYEKNRKDTLCEKFFGKFYACSYLMFSSAVFYDQIRRKDFFYELNDFCKFTCKDGNWTCESFFRYGVKNKQIGNLLKAIDFFMRQKYDFKSRLKTGKASKILQGIINKAIDEQREKQRASRYRVEIDVSRLQGIRNAALETQSKLLVSELEEDDATEFLNKKSVPKNEAGLGDTEYLFIQCLLYGREYNEYVKSKGLPLSVVVDAINEKLFDRFGDNVIIEIEGRPELIADYEEELKEIIRE